MAELLTEHKLPVIRLRIHSKLVKNGVQKSPMFKELRSIRDKIRYLRSDADVYAKRIYELESSSEIIKFVTSEPNYMKRELDDLHTIYREIITEVNSLIVDLYQKEDDFYKSKYLKDLFNAKKNENDDLIKNMKEIDVHLNATHHLSVMKNKFKKMMLNWYNSPHIHNVIIKCHKKLMTLHKSIMNEDIANSLLREIYMEVDLQKRLETSNFLNKKEIA